MRVGLIGFGAIASDICHFLERNAEVEVVTALVMPEDLSKEATFPLVTNFDEFIGSNLDIVVECAGHSAVQEFAPKVLAKDIDIVVVSIGALADSELYNTLQAAASNSQAQVILPAGALIGIDGLRAAKISGLNDVTIRSVKPPMSWSGAPGVEGLNLAAISEPTAVFEGSARDAARLFPKNANVAATAAIAGVGFDKTKVELIADPQTTQNSHTLTFDGVAGVYEIVTKGNPSPINPKTSQLTALSITRILQNRELGIAI